MSQTYDMRCRKLPLKSPGIIHFVRVFRRALDKLNGGVYPRGIITELEKAVRKKLTQC